MKKINYVYCSMLLMFVVLLSACTPRPYVVDYINVPLYFVIDARMTLCKTSWLSPRRLEVRAEDPELAPYYCVTQPNLGTIEQGTRFRIIRIPYRGSQSCFYPPEIYFDTGRFKGRRARLMYYPMQMKNPGVNGCQFRLPLWVKPVGVVSPEMRQVQRLTL
jgi:hypothetical protein